MEIWTFFFRHESNTHHPKSVPAVYIGVQVPPLATLEAGLALARAEGMPRGTHRTGCFEVQTPHGIHQHVEENRIDLTTPGKRAKVVFKSWEELEAMDPIQANPGQIGFLDTLRESGKVNMFGAAKDLLVEFPELHDFEAEEILAEWMGMGSRH